MRLVKFIRDWPPYVSNETALFTDQEAARFIKIGVAVHATPLLDRAAAALGLKSKKPDATMAPEKDHK